MIMNHHDNFSRHEKHHKITTEISASEKSNSEHSFKTYDETYIKNINILSNCVTSFPFEVSFIKGKIVW